MRKYNDFHGIVLFLHSMIHHSRITFLEKLNKTNTDLLVTALQGNEELAEGGRLSREVTSHFESEHSRLGITKGMGRKQISSQECM
jgi:hypothetical protein